MKRKMLLLLLIITVSLAGCQDRGAGSGEKPASENSVSAPQVQTSEPFVATDSSQEPSASEPSADGIAVNIIPFELTVPKIAANQESVLEEVTFRLNLPEYMTVEYVNKIPSVYDGNTQYMRTSSMSSGWTEERVLSRPDKEITAQKLDINAYNTILVTEPVEEPTSGIAYKYYILFDDDTMLPLSFFSPTGSDNDKDDFNRIVSSFELS